MSSSSRHKPTKPKLPLCKCSHKEIYKKRGDLYHLLISRQDYQHNLARALAELQIFKPDVDVIELGAGTGRLTCMLTPLVRSIHAFDSSPHMLEHARLHLQQQEQQMNTAGSPSASSSSSSSNWRLSVGNNRHIASFGLTSGCVDIVIAGQFVFFTILNPQKCQKKKNQ